MKNVGALGHACSDEQYDTSLKTGAVEETPLEAAEHIVLLERAKELLLG